MWKLYYKEEKAMNITLRRGYIKISKEMLMDIFHKNMKCAIDAMVEIFGKNIVLEANETKDGKCIEYLLCSYHFKELAMGDDVPWYAFELAPNGTLIWNEIPEPS
jgi:hypothetical protein